MKMKKTGMQKLLKYLILIAAIILLIYQAEIMPETRAGKEAEAPTISPAPVELSSEAISLSLPAGLYSPNFIVMRLDSQKPLLEKGGGDRIYPASLTKIMTTIVAIENLEDLEQKLLLSDELFDALYAENSSMAGFLPGEEIAARDLLFGIMLPSGGECCVGIAEEIAGTEESFVTLMNLKAEELGMKDTHFTNTTGLHDTEHFSTVRDLAVLLQYSLQNDTFRRIFTSKQYTAAPTNLHPEGVTMYSTMFKSLEDNSIMNGELLGGKTGYTSKAGLCLASLARIGDTEYIMISAGAKGNHKTEQFNISDALTVYSRIGSRH